MGTAAVRAAVREDPSPGLDHPHLNAGQDDAGTHDSLGHADGAASSGSCVGEAAACLRGALPAGRVGGRARTGGAGQSGGGGREKKVEAPLSARPERPSYPKAVPTIIVRVPIRTSRGLNAREHWAARARRVKAERWAVGMVLNPLPRPQLPCDVALVRLGPVQRFLDDDNLQGALKAVRDEVAVWLGVDDASPLVRWHYGQERSHEWAVAIFVRDVGSW